MNHLPQDPFILYSYVNTQLRDRYASLTEFCAAEEIAERELLERLSAAGFSYDREQNCFR